MHAKLYDPQGTDSDDSDDDYVGKNKKKKKPIMMPRFIKN